MFVCPYTQTQFKIDALVFFPYLVVILLCQWTLFCSHHQESFICHLVPDLRVQKYKVLPKLPKLF